MKRTWLALLLTACAAPTWDKAGATPQAMEADLKQCEAAAPLEPQARQQYDRLRFGLGTCVRPHAQGRRGHRRLHARKGLRQERLTR